MRAVRGQGKRIGASLVVVILVFSIAEDLLVPLVLLEADIEVDLITSPPNMRTDMLLILLLCFSSISSITLIKDIVLLNPLSIMVLNYKSKTFGKSPCLEMLKRRIGVRNNTTISRLYMIAFGDTLSYVSNLGSKLVVDDSHFWC
jgi:hypothetical protein